MTPASESAAPAQSTWRFPAAFWIANGIELFERAAYYGLFIALALFLTSVSGFTDVEAGYVGGAFAALVYFLPFLTGALADRMGYRASLALAFTLLAAGYAGTGMFATSKVLVELSLLAVAIGGSFVKPIITGTVARSSDASNRARAYSLFYMMVNIGSFSGKTIAKPVRTLIGLNYVPLYSAGAAAIALVLVLLFYFPRPTENDSKTAPPSLEGLVTVLRNGRYMALILITAGFWIIQGQLYASMPKYVLRMVGEGASPEWYANVNPFVVVLCVVPITHLARRLSPVASIAIALVLVPGSALLMAFSNLVNHPIPVLGYAVHPVTLFMLIGIGVQGLAECFLSPRYLEYASKQAPPGQEGLYLGYSNLNNFFAYLFGFVASGYLLEAFCPDPKTLSATDQAARVAALAGHGPMPAAYAHAHYLWFAFAGVGVLALLTLLAFQWITQRVPDRRRP